MSTVTIECLPDAIIEYILSYLSPYRDVKQCMLVNKAWYSYCRAVIQKTKRDFLHAVSSMNIEWHTCQPTPGPTIAKRYSHSSCCLGDSMYVFGGCTTANTTFNDLWRLDLSTRTWIRPLAIGTYPPPKACASMVVYKDLLIVMGGWTHTSPYPLHQQTSWQIFNHLHTYDTISNRWNLVMSPTYCPKMAGHSATVHGDSMVVFGGLRCTENYATFKSSNDIWVLDLVNITWKKQPVDITQPQPLPRYGHSQVYLDPHHDIIIGGCGGPNKLFSDMWLLTMSENPQEPWKWTQLQIRAKEYGTSHLSFHPAVRVQNRLLVLSIAQSTFGPQSTLPCNLRVQSRTWVPPRSEEKSRSSYSSLSHVPVRSYAQNNWGENELGKLLLKRQWQKNPAEESSSEEEEVARGKKSASQEAATSSCEDSPTPSTSAGSSNPPQNSSSSRPLVSVRPNARHNRQKQLDGLNRMEQRLRNLRTCGVPNSGLGYCHMRNSMPLGHSDPVPGQKLMGSYYRNPMCLYVMDLSQVLVDGTISWLPSCQVPGPEEIILYSLVVGRGEIIMFGGIQKDIKSSNRNNGEAIPEIVSNDLHFITAKKFVI